MKDVNYLKSNGVDVDHGVELLGDMEMYDSIMKDFLDAYDERMKKIDNLKNSGDMANYAIEVHSLKSDSKYLGFMNLADIAYKHELASKASDINTVNNTYPQLINEANRIINIVKTYLGINSNNDIPTVLPDEAEVVIPQVNEVSYEEVSLATKAILVADDSSITRNFVSEIYSNKYQVIMASNGNEVINIVNANPDKIAILLLDLNMPGMSGFDVLEYFKQNNLFSKIPVSIISGSSDKESINKAFTYPIVDMLNKPFSKEDVKVVVEKTINYANIA